MMEGCAASVAETGVREQGQQTQGNRISKHLQEADEEAAVPSAISPAQTRVYLRRSRCKFRGDSPRIGKTFTQRKKGRSIEQPLLIPET
jgi:hypothetical protein